MSKKISFLDKTFWITESEDNPKHVAALQLLDMPEDAPDDYMQKLFVEMRSFTQASSPFNCRVRSFLGFPLSLVPLDTLDMDYHVQMHVIGRTWLVRQCVWRISRVRTPVTKFVTSRFYAL